LNKLSNSQHLLNTQPVLNSFKAIPWFWVVFALGLGFRLCYVLSGIVDLAADEAYYWQWSRQLDWSYYSKGPLIAYLIFIGTSIFGDNAFGVRAHTIFLSGYTLFISCLFFLRLFPKQYTGAVLLAVFYNTIPLMMAGSMISNIDPPLIAFWVTGTWALHVAVNDHKNWAWGVLALSLGLGILAKYTMLLFLFTVILYLLLSPKGRTWLTHPAPYLSILGGLLFLAPPIIWNLQHDWVTYHHTSDISHLDAEFIWYENLKYFPTMIVTQAGFVSPILFVLLVIGMVHHIKKAFGENKNDIPLILTCSFLPVFILYTLVSLKREINPNWVVAMYPAMIIAASQYWGKKWDEGKGKPWVISGAALGTLMCLIMLFFDVFYLVGVPNAAQYDPSARLKGWHEMAAIAEQSASKLPQDQNYFYFGTRYQVPSQLAFYVDGQPKTYSIPHPFPDTQYDVWGGGEKLVGQNAVFVRRDKPGESSGMPGNVMQSFERIEPEVSTVVHRLGQPLLEVHTWRCYGFKGWNQH
jgi:undecaprenyl-diphosphatase